VIGRDGDVRRALVDHAQNRCDDAAHGRHFAAIAVAGGGQRVIMAEQLVGAVYEMDVQKNLLPTL
jgi:6-phosphogluconolactonase/glucosamine-6-phosphate isomerase/deaminase